MKKLLTILFLLVPLFSYHDNPQEVPRNIYAEWNSGTIKVYDPIFGLSREKRDAIIEEIYEENS
jgi:hypothetical protein